MTGVLYLVPWCGLRSVFRVPCSMFCLALCVCVSCRFLTVSMRVLTAVSVVGLSLFLRLKVHEKRLVAPTGVRDGGQFGSVMQVSIATPTASTSTRSDLASDASDLCPRTTEVRFRGDHTHRSFDGEGSAHHASPSSWRR